MAAFLHENLPHFVGEGAISEAAVALRYLSAADALASSVRWGSDAPLVADDLPAAALADAAAASVAARGVCFANAHPAPHRWLPLKAPALFAAQRAWASNREQLRAAAAPAWALHGGASCLLPADALATELLPYARVIQAGANHAGAGLACLQPARWSRVWEARLYQQTLAGGAEPLGGAAAAAGAQEGGLAATGADVEHQEAQLSDAIEPDSDEEDW